MASEVGSEEKERVLRKGKVSPSFSFFNKKNEGKEKVIMSSSEIPELRGMTNISH